MLPKKTTSKALKNHPLFQGATPLEFDMEEEELLELTDEQLEDHFMSRWVDTMRPFWTYKRYLDNASVGRETILRHVKRHYTLFVTQGSWSEDKYLVVVDALLVSTLPFTTGNLEAKGPLYDEERLPMQLHRKRKTRSRL